MGSRRPGRSARRAPLLPADLDGGRGLSGGARHAGGGGGRLQESAGVWQAPRGMNEPGSRHGEGGRGPGHGAREAGPVRRRRIRRGLLLGPRPARPASPASPASRSGRGAPLPEGSAAVGRRRRGGAAWVSLAPRCACRCGGFGPLGITARPPGGRVFVRVLQSKRSPEKK